ncbi:MerR family transcriptional regulator [Arthrobacter sp. TMN-49]
MEFVENLLISEVAERSGVLATALRCYEDIGLIGPAPGNPGTHCGACRIGRPVGADRGEAFGNSPRRRRLLCLRRTTGGGRGT